MAKENKDLIRKHVDAIILIPLLEKDCYGYEILKSIETNSKGLYTLKQPTLYSCLKRLEQQGKVSSYLGDTSNGAQRRYYALTDEGKAYVKAYQNEWIYVKTILASLISNEDFDITKSNVPFNASDLRPLTKRVKSEYDNEELLDTDEDDDVVTECTDELINELTKNKLNSFSSNEELSNYLKEVLDLRDVILVDDENVVLLEEYDSDTDNHEYKEDSSCSCNELEDSCGCGTECDCLENNDTCTCNTEDSSDNEDIYENFIKYLAGDNSCDCAFTKTDGHISEDFCDSNYQKQKEDNCECGPECDCLENNDTCTCDDDKCNCGCEEEEDESCSCNELEDNCECGAECNCDNSSTEINKDDDLFKTLRASLDDEESNSDDLNSDDIKEEENTEDSNFFSGLQDMLSNFKQDDIFNNVNNFINNLSEEDKQNLEEDVENMLNNDTTENNELLENILNGTGVNFKDLEEKLREKLNALFDNNAVDNKEDEEEQDEELEAAINRSMGSNIEEVLEEEKIQTQETVKEEPASDILLANVTVTNNNAEKTFDSHIISESSENSDEIDNNHDDEIKYELTEEETDFINNLDTVLNKLNIKEDNTKLDNVNDGVDFRDDAHITTYEFDYKCPKSESNKDTEEIKASYDCNSESEDSLDDGTYVFNITSKNNAKVINNDHVITFDKKEENPGINENADEEDLTFNGVFNADIEKINELKKLLRDNVNNDNIEDILNQSSRLKDSTEFCSLSNGSSPDEILEEAKKLENIAKINTIPNQFEATNMTIEEKEKFKNEFEESFNNLISSEKAVETKEMEKYEKLGVKLTYDEKVEMYKKQFIKDKQLENRVKEINYRIANGEVSPKNRKDGLVFDPKTIDISKYTTEELLLNFGDIVKKEEEEFYKNHPEGSELKKNDGKPRGLYD